MAREEIGSWLSGPPAQGKNAGPQDWPGQNLGLAESGSGAAAGLGRRIAALAVDWLLAMVVGTVIDLAVPFSLAGIGGVATVNFAVWALAGILGVALFAQTAGQAALGIGVARVDRPGESVGLIRALVRMLLIFVILPAIVIDQDGRGMHDRASGTALVRA